MTTASPTPFILGRDINGNVDYSISPSSLVYNATLTEDDETTITVPTTAAVWKVLFSIEDGSNVWVAYGATAAAPAGATLASATSELNPKIRFVDGGTVIHVITDSTTAAISVSLYAARNNY